LFDHELAGLIAILFKAFRQFGFESFDLANLNRQRVAAPALFTVCRA
jgi:hypothetical protein